MARRSLPEQIRRPGSLAPSLPSTISRATTTNDQDPTFVIAVDFGTTYSTVAFAKGNAGTDMKRLRVGDIHCVANYRNVTGSGASREKARNENVPTEILYLAKTSENSDSDSDLELRDLELGADALNSHLSLLERGKSRKRSKPDPQPPQWVRQAFIKWVIALINHSNTVSSTRKAGVRLSS